MIEKQIKSSRIEWIDVAKGIGICMVIFAHFIPYHTSSIITESVYYVFYMIHMPLFFFLSGYVYKVYTNNIQNTIYHFTQLIIPYYSYFILVYPILLTLGISNALTLKEITKYIWGGYSLLYTVKALLIAMWFLTCLFFTRIVYNWLQTNIKKEIYVHLFILVVLFLCYYFNVELRGYRQPFGLHMVPFALVIFHLGHTYRQCEAKIPNLFFSILGIVGIVFTIYYNLNTPEFYKKNTIDMFAVRLGIPVITLLCSIFAIILIKNISIGITKVKPLHIIFRELGMASLVIMALHFVIQRIILTFCPYSPSLAVMSISVLAICYLTYRVFSYFEITKLLFLGKGIKRDKIKTIFSK